MQKILLLFVFCISLFVADYAQKNIPAGNIDILADSRIDNLVSLEQNIDEMPGYRLQICFDSDKRVIDEARDRFLKLYPLTATYVEFNAPHFNLKVGDYRTRLEAEKVKRQIFGEFVICIIHEDLIQLPRLD